MAPDLARRPLHLPQQDHRLQDLLRSQGENLLRVLLAEKYFFELDVLNVCMLKLCILLRLTFQTTTDLPQNTTNFKSPGERPKHRLVDRGRQSLVDRPSVHRRSRRQLQDNWGADQLQGLRLHLLQPEAPLGSTWQGSQPGRRLRHLLGKPLWLSSSR